MSDLFHPSVPDHFIDRVFAVMAIAQHHVFQVLTKRPARMRAYLTDEDLNARISGALGAMLDGDWIRREGKRHWPRIDAMIDAFIGVRVDDADLGHEHLQDPMPLPNVWLGTSVEDQVAANQRIPELMQTPAAVRFLSCEPLLGPVRLSASRYDALQGHIRMRMGQHNAAGAWDEGDYMMIGYGTVHWVIVGGESGPNARPMHPDWARRLRDECVAADVPFLFKQWGEWNVASAENGVSGSLMPDTGERYTWLGIDGRTSNPSFTGLPEPVYAMARLGKKAAGRHLDGRTWDEAPA